MKTIVCVFIILATSSCFPQDLQPEGPYSVTTIRNFLDFPDSLGSGFAEKRINRLGDGASIALMKILSSDQLQDPVLEDRILIILDMAFQAPAIVRPEDRHPKVTLLLLNYLILSKPPDAQLARINSLQLQLRQLDSQLTQKEKVK
jgi:hypothetical protein